jgi:hypothetical protein
MNQRTDRGLRIWVLAACGALLAILSSTALQAQPDRKPEPKKDPMLVFSIIATEKGDKEALEAAKKYFADLHTNPVHQQEEAARKEKGEPPLFPNATKTEEPAPEGTTIAVERAVGAAALPQLGLADCLLAAALLAPGEKKAETAKAKEGANRYRWAQLQGRDLKLLHLDGPPTDEVGKAMENNTPFLHAVPLDEKVDEQKWVLYARSGAAKGAVDYFLLLRDPPVDKEITDDHLRLAARGGTISRPLVLLYFNDAGKKRLLEFTKAYQPAAQGKSVNLSAIVIRSRVKCIWGVTDENPDGVMELSGLAPAEVANTLKDIQALIKKPGQ